MAVNTNNTIKNIEHELVRLNFERSKKIYKCKHIIEECRIKTESGNPNYAGASMIWEGFLKEARKKSTTILLTTAFLKCCNTPPEQFIADIKYAVHNNILSFASSSNNPPSKFFNQLSFEWSEWMIDPKNQYLEKYSKESKNHEINFRFTGLLLKSSTNNVRIRLPYHLNQS